MKDWTQIPNFLWDRQDLTVYERIILVHVIRTTIGWGEQEDGISCNQIEDDLDISITSVEKAINGLVEKQLIEKENQVDKYQIADLVIQAANDIYEEQ